jgi:hypothetical protein
MKKQPKELFLFPNGMVIVLDADGEQIPEYQGNHEYAKAQLQGCDLQECRFYISAQGKILVLSREAKESDYMTQDNDWRNKLDGDWNEWYPGMLEELAQFLKQQDPQNFGQLVEQPTGEDDESDIDKVFQQARELQQKRFLESRCNWCDEKVEKLDPRVPEGLQPMHYECSARSLLGSVAHQKGECSCYGGSGEDDPALTKRQAALAALVFYQSGWSSDR